MSFSRGDTVTHKGNINRRVYFVHSMGSMPILSGMMVISTNERELRKILNISLCWTHDKNYYVLAKKLLIERL